MIFKGRIEGTINDEFEVEADSEEQARELALMEWRYVEFEDLEVSSIEATAETCHACAGTGYETDASSGRVLTYCTSCNGAGVLEVGVS